MVLGHQGQAACCLGTDKYVCPHGNQEVISTKADKRFQGQHKKGGYLWDMKAAAETFFTHTYYLFADKNASFKMLKTVKK